MLPFDYGKILDSYGAKIGLPAPLDRPIMRDIGFDIKSGELTEVAMIPTGIETTDDAISTFDPEDRGCYTAKEFQLRYRSNYSMNNCLYDAFLQKVIDDCKCAYNFEKTVRTRNPMIYGCGMKGKDLACSESLVKHIKRSQHAGAYSFGFFSSSSSSFVQHFCKFIINHCMSASVCKCQ